METDPTSPPSSTNGSLIHSESQPGVVYQLGEAVRRGGMSVAYLAQRQSEAGTSPVVVNVMKPSLGRGMVSAHMVAEKERVALSRLNDAVPPTPFVVRLIDSGSAQRGAVAVPWTAVEYVHGGVEGTTLNERVKFSLNKTGQGFSPGRAAHLLHCLSSGLSAVHNAQVVHRNLSPNNVLCCGFGETEIFKISDFGVARSDGVMTFGSVAVGTMCYSAPESASSGVGAETDVFSLACIIYFALTGQHYFKARTAAEFLTQFESESRASLYDHVTLHADLQHRDDLVRELDAVLKRATAARPSERPSTPRELAQLMLPWLSDQAGLPASSRRLAHAVGSTPPSSSTHRYEWVIKSRPKSATQLISAAWDADGNAFALSHTGANFWNGHTWVDATSLLQALRHTPTFVQRYEAGGWLIGGQGPELTILDASGTGESAVLPAPEVSVSGARGRFDDLLVVVASEAGKPPALWTRVARRWMRPFPLNGASQVTTINRLDDERWLVGGATPQAGPFAAVYAPLQQELRTLPVLGSTPLRASATVLEQGLGCVVGGSGCLTVSEAGDEWALVNEQLSATAVAIDVQHHQWIGGRGCLWSRDAQGQWLQRWAHPEWTGDFCALLADGDRILGMTTDGGIIEGRQKPSVS